MKELITEICNRYNIELSSEELQQFEKFLEIFIETNTSINLSAIREAKEIIEKHFIDSIMLDVFFSFTNSSYKETDLEVEGIPSKNHIKIADMGTGGGFPLIPLAIIHPEIEFIGIDSVGKKLSAINTFIDTLGLSNASTLQGRAEEIARLPEHREHYDYITSRATAFLPTLLEYTIPLLKVGGMLIAYKLDDPEELKSAKKALSRLSAKIYKVKNYQIGGQKRVLIFIEKLHPTLKMYPRKVGIPLKSPIK